MNWYSVFYWLTRADDIKGFFDSLSNCCLVFSILFFIVYWIIFIAFKDTESNHNLDEENEKSFKYWLSATRKTFFWFFSIMIVTWTIYVLVPSKKDALIIVAGGAIGNFVTTDSSAKAIPAELTKYVRNYLKNEAEDLDAETKEELGLATPKDKLMNKVKDMTRDEIIEYIKTDTTVVK